MNIPEILSWEQLAEQIRTWQACGERVVFTNGVFDILHVGHTRYLREAKSLGDRLVVGINSDESVRRLKGPTRPINPELDRAEVMASLDFVDGVTIFADDTPIPLLRILRPDIHAKGGDYKTPDALPETEVVRAYGGDVVILQLVDGKSTTGIVKKMQEHKP
jgi:rfaE bifunctional protein nucleotidyltransferase chain/domain